MPDNSLANYPTKDNATHIYLTYDKHTRNQINTHLTLMMKHIDQLPKLFQLIENKRISVTNSSSCFGI